MKLRKLLLSVIFLIGLISAKSQNWEWAHAHDLGSESHGQSIGLDSTGNIYTLSFIQYFTGGGGSYYYDMFSKYDSLGNLIWKDTLTYGALASVTNKEGSTYMVSDWLYKFDNNGQLIFTKDLPDVNFLTTCLYIDNKVLVSGLGYIGGKQHSHIALYDETGNLKMFRTEDSSFVGKVITCDKLGNIYTGGGTYPDSTTSNSGFLAKYDSTGI